MPLRSLCFTKTAWQTNERSLAAARSNNHNQIAFKPHNDRCCQQETVWATGDSCQAVKPRHPKLDRGALCKCLHCESP